MALTRKMLKAMGIDDEKIDQIIEAHTEVTDAIKAERDEYKSTAERVPELQEEVARLQANSGDEYKGKFEALTADFEAYKTAVATENENRVKAELYRDALLRAGVDEKRIATVLRVADLNGITVTDGKIDGEEQLLESIKADWSDFIVSTNVKNDQPATPPSSDPAVFDGMSLVEKMAYANSHPGDPSVVAWLSKS